MAKVVKKHWVEIVPPAMFQGRSIGESHVQSADQLIGRTIKANLMNLTNDPKRQNINLDFKVVHAKEGKALTQLVTYKLSQSSIKRYVRRGGTRIDDSFLCQTKDNVNVRVKPFFLTRGRVSGAVASAIRQKAVTFLRSKAAGQSYEHFADAIVGYKLQRELRGIMKKIHPLKSCEVRWMGVTDEKAPEPTKSAVQEVKKVGKEVKKVEKTEAAPTAQKEDTAKETPKKKAEGTATETKEKSDKPPASKAKSEKTTSAEKPDTKKKD